MAAVAGITILILLQVVAREVFSAGIPWADELSRWLGFWVIFLVVPILMARDEHVKVDFFIARLAPPLRRLVMAGNEVLGVVFCAAFLIAGWMFMQRAWRFSTPAMGWPNLVWYAPAMLGMALLFLVTLRRALLALAGRPYTSGGNQAGADHAS